MDRDNIAGFPRMFEESRLTGRPRAHEPEDLEILALAERYGDPGSRALYRVSTVYHERHRRAHVSHPVSDPGRAR